MNCLGYKMLDNSLRQACQFPKVDLASDSDRNTLSVYFAKYEWLKIIFTNNCLLLIHFTNKVVFSSLRFFVGWTVCWFVRKITQ